MKFDKTISDQLNCILNILAMLTTYKSHYLKIFFVFEYPVF